jgi:hypothetical protein
MDNINSYGYVYIRSHESFKKYGVYKLGITINIINRESTYKTNEYCKGKFKLVIKIKENLKTIENLLGSYFYEIGLYRYLEWGTEFYDKSIIDKIIPYLNYLNIPFTVLTKEEIKEINRKIKNQPQKINISSQERNKIENELINKSIK